MKSTVEITIRESEHTWCESGGREKFLTQLMQMGGIAKVNKDGELTAQVPPAAYRRVKRLAFACGLTTQVARNSRKGAYFLLRAALSRVGVIFGVMAFVIIFTVMSHFIFAVRVFGVDGELKEQTLRAAAQAGVKIHARTNYNRNLAENYIRHTVKNLAWVNITQNGALTTIEASESIPEEEKEIAQGSPCNVVAAKSGVIVSAQVFMGKTAGRRYTDEMGQEVFVSAIMTGNGVKEGQLLVHAGGGTADAKIIAEIHETQGFYVPFAAKRTVRTGESFADGYIEFLGWKLPSGITTPVSGINYIKETTTRPTLLGFPLPFTTTQRKYEAAKKTTIVKSAKDTVSELDKAIETYRENVLKNSARETEIVDTRVSYIPSARGAGANVEFIYRENIAKQVLVYGEK